MAQVAQGGSITFTARFYTNLGGPLVDPSDLSIDIVYNENVLATYEYPEDIQRSSTGVYYFVYPVPVDFPVGDYIARWTGIINTSPRIGEEDFTVVEPGTVTPGAGGGVSLAENEFISFAGEISPLYLDPDELTAIYPSATRLEIAELIYRFSLEIDGLMGTPTQDALDYIFAATACALSRVYDDALTGPGSYFMLGDLQVGGSSGSSRSGASSSAPDSWCDLALMLRKLLRTTGSKTMKPTRKAEHYRNPIPSRAFKRYR